MKKVTTIIPTAILLFLSCSKTEIDTQAKLMSDSKLATTNSTEMAVQNKTSGISNTIPAYYDSSLFKIIFVEFSAQAEASQIAHNKSLNFIYQSDPGLPNNQPFISVIDAIPGDGFNPVWREVQIVFNAGFTPRQLFSDNEVLAAASGTHPEITLNMTNEVYWCPVIGQKPVTGTK
ncbi:hypothetical protein FHW36_106418 [Chitinophaga polysaccharea]|uniref:Uncharacterized protein n=1 Tax=Chitinophaga polysaccharea TaxID=1293035 RepID=A0A561PM42_9BACT|nr:hypothetical protein [Chitinophaga polysaccharea]TWF39187.1 hypothetical protein FHW36_106418 [Chitinophaga polysaccharea]